MRLPLALLFLVLPLAARAADAVPADAAWAIVAPQAAAGAAMGAALQQAADTRGLQQGFAAGLRAGVGFDPFDAAALEAAGVDTARPLAIASRDGVELAAVHLRPGPAGREHLAAWLAPLGEVAAAKAHRGWALQLATREGRPTAGYAMSGNRAVSARLATRGGDVAATLRAAIDAAAGQGALAGAPLFRAVRGGEAAPWYLWLRRPAGTAAAALSLEGARLQARGRVADRQAAAWLGKGGAFPEASPGDELLLARLSLSPASRRAGGAVAGGVRFLLAQACPRCDGAALLREANALAAQLAGPAAVALSRLEIRALADGWTPAATPFTWVAEVRDPAAARAWLDRIAGLVGAEGEGDRTVDSPLGPLSFGLRGRRLFVASDPALRDRLLAATAGASTGSGPPLRTTVAPAALGRALSSLAVTDALRGGLLGSLFAVRLQLGPLLRESGPLRIEAGPAGENVQFDATWELRR